MKEGQVVKMDHFVQSMKALENQLNDKLASRPTMKQLKQQTTKIEDKINMINSEFSNRLDNLTRQQNSFDNELKQ